MSYYFLLVLLGSYSSFGISQEDTSRPAKVQISYNEIQRVLSPKNQVFPADGSDFPAQGEKQVQVYLFWASWCDSCKNLLKNLQQLYTTDKAIRQRVSILTISLDENKEDLLSSIRQGKNQNFRVYWAGSIIKQDKFRYIPATYFYSSEGKGLRFYHGAGKGHLEKIRSALAYYSNQ